MTEIKNIHPAMRELYPNAIHMIDWLYVSAEPEAVMQLWNTEKLGTLNMDVLKVRDAEIEARPKPKLILTPLQFKELFTQAERMQMRQVGKSNALVEDFLDLLNSATSVDIDDIRTQSALDYFIVLDVITAARKAEVVSAFNV